MGPIEAELRNYPCRLMPYAWQYSHHCSQPCFDVMCYAARSLGMADSPLPSDETGVAEVLSEAIEAAEALGL
jgi:hypothetical protein